MQVGLAMRDGRPLRLRLLSSATITLIPWTMLVPRGKGWKGGPRDRKLPGVDPPPHASARYTMPRLTQGAKRTPMGCDASLGSANGKRNCNALEPWSPGIVGPPTPAQ